MLALLCGILLAAEPSSSVPPAGWWIVVASNGTDVGTPGAAWQFGSEIVAVDAARTGLRRTPLACAASSAKSWRCERTLSNGIHVLDLRLGRDGELTGTIRLTGHDSYGAFNARRATADEAKGLDTLATQWVAVDAESCAAAKRCYDVACPAFDEPSEPCVFERQGMAHDGPSCRAYVPMLAATLKAIGKSVPKECQAAPK